MVVLAMIWATAAAAAAAGQPVRPTPKPIEPVPSLAIIRGTDLGAQPVPEGSIPRVSIGADGRMIPLPRDQWISLRQEEQFDAIVYTGAAAPAPALSSAICNDPAFVRTRLERMKFAGLPPSVPDRLRSLCGTP